MSESGEELEPWAAEPVAAEMVSQSLPCAGCHGRVDVAISFAVLSMDRSEWGLPCVAVFCAPACLIEFARRQPIPPLYALCDACEGAGFVPADEDGNPEL